MSKSQRDKGASFEREVAAIFTDHLGVKFKRNLAQSRGGATEGSDLIVGPFSVECKRRAKMSIYEWLDQAQRDAGDKIPMVIARADGRRAVLIMDLQAALPMIGGEIL
jgi:hypothetical protein